MIVGGYTLDLYCDNPDCEHKPHRGPAAEYTHELGSVCRRLAKKDGWKLNHRQGIATCPHCASPTETEK